MKQKYKMNSLQIIKIKKSQIKIQKKLKNNQIIFTNKRKK